MSDPGLICHHVALGARPVLAVFRYAEGDWALTCGLPEHGAESWLPLAEGEPEALLTALEAPPPPLVPGRVAWRAEAGDVRWRVEPLPADADDA